MRDTRLGRNVAIKTVPPEFEADPERLARFEREAKFLSSLNHSNIAAIYGLERSADSRFLVLELVEAETLAERLKRGQLSGIRRIPRQARTGDGFSGEPDRTLAQPPVQIHTVLNWTEELKARVPLKPR